MSLFSIYSKSRTISGVSTHVIKLDHKFSKFNPKAVPAINIEELNSGIYALRHLTSALQSLNASPSSFLNANNTIFPTTELKKEILNATSSLPARSTQSLGTTVEAIQENTALATVLLINKGLTQLIDKVTEINLATLGSITTAQIVIKPLLGLTSLSNTQKKTVMASAVVPSPEELVIHVKKEKAEEIKKEQDKLREALEAAGTSQDEIDKLLATYANSFANDFIKNYIEKPLLAYRAEIGVPIKAMNQALLSIAAAVPDLTPDNANIVNGMITLRAIFEGLQTAMDTVPALGGDAEIIQIIQALTPYLSKTTFSEAELKTIYTATALPNKSTFDRYLTSQQVARYREKITSIYQKTISNLNSVRQTIQNNKKIIEEQLSMFQQAQACFTSWVDQAFKLKTAISGKFSSYALTASMEMFAALLCLSFMYEKLATPEKTIFDNFVEQFLKLRVISDGDFVYGWIAKMNAYQELAEYSLSTAVTNTTLLSDRVKARGIALAKDRRFFTDVGSKMQHLTQETSFPSYYMKQGNVYLPDLDHFMDVNLVKGTIESKFEEKSRNILSQFNAVAGAHVLTLQTQIAALDTQHTNLNPGSASFTEQRKTAVESWLKAESLGSSLIYMILNSQLPKQAEFLTPLIEEINFNNIAANALNDLLKITNEFAVTSVYYNFSSYLVQSKEGEDLFAGDYYEALLGLAREREYIARDTERCKRAAELINTLLEKIKHLPGVTTAQKQAMLNATSFYQYSLTITFNQLTVLDSLFVKLKMTPLTKDKKYDKQKFKITAFTDWIPSLAALEGFISNGFPNITPTGGLGPLFTQVQSDQQNYTTQSQTQQLTLQNQMTNIQQEWTLVSTSMQVLNQILSRLAGDIYSN
ncbi:CT620/CT621 family type III secretion system effector [Candidatus Chlamydia sanziniae]|uniref:Effector from type III secretion system family protein n=1 Tax=Candidatus Chlamydia sanziniae TaxID=1806891 RepID=A0A1A9HWR9_9CHLA|nr:CT620/CT621 family type III secretion system effector [Candidatus Chlamydia sanziniae]ANH78532.1 hypothetical protein Cs308_0361 [Candidatus Chlamydia sanziniae]